MPQSLSKRIDKLAGRQREDIFVLMPPELVLDKERTLLNISTGKFHKTEDLQSLGGKLIDCFPNTK